MMAVPCVWSGSHSAVVVVDVVMLDVVLVDVMVELVTVDDVTDVVVTVVVDDVHNAYCVHKNAHEPGLTYGK